MNGYDISGTTEISGEGIKKHFKSIDPWGALFELAWNGFDANATQVDINVTENELGGIEAVNVQDNGDGIDIANIKDNFGRFNDSLKKEDAGQHGLHGRGRLAFHRLCNEAVWETKSKVGAAKISIKSANIKRFDGAKINPESQHASLVGVPSGTCVELRGFHENLPSLDKLRNYLSTEFGWFLALNSTKSLRINGHTVNVPAHEIHHEQLTSNGSIFDVKIIRWLEKPNSEKSQTYLLNSAGRAVHKQLSSFNHKSNFFTSIYIQSPWADSFVAGGENLFTASNKTTDSEEWKKAVKFVAEFAQRVYEDFLRRFVDAEIEAYVEDGIFPVYAGLDKDYANWRMDNTKSIVRAVYTADPTVFNSLNKKQKKVLVRLLDRMAVSNENDAIFEILNSVLDLDTVSVEKLAKQLKKSRLENIISTIEIIQQRQTAVHQLRELMNVHYRDVLETPDLQQIIENNTWLFGHRYETLGAEEDTFTKIAKDLRNKFRDIDHVGSEDVEDGASIEGANRQSDLFLARRVLSTDSFGRQIYRCIIIEIKRPSVSLNVKHLRQLDDYAAISK